VFKSFKINGVKIENKTEEDSAVFNNRKSNRLFCYYVTNDEPLELEISVPKHQTTSIELYEASNDLLENELFSIPKRSKDMIPKPFVLNDAIIVKKTISLE
jgi:hypothetical protein